jgi:hypothetical protein
LSGNTIGNKGFKSIMSAIAKTAYLSEDVTQPYFFDFRNNMIDEKALEDVS